MTSNGDGGNRAAGSGDGASTAESSEPNHDFVFVAAASGGRGEDVVGYVGDNVATGLHPTPGRNERFDGADLDSIGLGDDVGV